jgi:restriction endonuclease S subunit
MEVLKNLEIKVPSLQTQNAILEITKLRLREKKLNKKIKTLRDSIIDHQLSKVLNNV